MRVFSRIFQQCSVHCDASDSCDDDGTVIRKLFNRRPVKQVKSGFSSCGCNSDERVFIFDYYFLSTQHRLRHFQNITYIHNFRILISTFCAWCDIYCVFLHKIWVAITNLSLCCSCLLFDRIAQVLLFKSK